MKGIELVLKMVDLGIKRMNEDMFEMGSIDLDQMVWNEGRLSQADSEIVRSRGRDARRNLIVFSGSFLCAFLAANSLNALQTSFNSADSLGAHVLTAIAVSFNLSSLFVPALLAKYVPVKWSLVACQACMCVYVAANFCARAFALMPAAVVFGAATSVLWTFQGTVINHLAVEYSHGARHETVDTILMKFMGIFYLFYQSSRANFY